MEGGEDSELADVLAMARLVAARADEPASAFADAIALWSAPLADEVLEEADEGEELGNVLDEAALAAPQRERYGQRSWQLCQHALHCRQLLREQRENANLERSKQEAQQQLTVVKMVFPGVAKNNCKAKPRLPNNSPAKAVVMTERV